MATRRLRARYDGRWYGDFREFARFGGRQEALIPPDEKKATTNEAIAEQLYDRRYQELLQLRIHLTPVADPALEVGDACISTQRALERYIERMRPFTDSQITRDRHLFCKVICGIMPPGRTIADVNQGDVIDFLGALKDKARNHRQQPYSGSFRSKVLTFLQLALDSAQADGLISKNPARNLEKHLKPPTDAEEVTQFYSTLEAGQLLWALASLPNGDRPKDWPAKTPYYIQAQVAFALFTGARRNEILAERWEWIDWERNLLKVHTSKRARGENRGKLLHRTIPLWPQLRAILRALWMRQGQPRSGLVFPKLRPRSGERKHVPRFERGGCVDKSLWKLLRIRGLLTGGIKGEPLQVFGKLGYHLSWREFRVTYCATRLQTVEPVVGRIGEWVPVAQRTVELEMGHASGKMIQAVYGRVLEAQEQLRLRAVEYPIKEVHEQVLRSSVGA